MALNEYHGLIKTFHNKIMAFSLNVRKVRSLLHEVKNDKIKSRSVENQAGFKLHVTFVCYY